MTLHDDATSLDAFTADWEAWHLRRDAALAHEHGFLAVTGLYWPGTGPQRLPGVPGTWSAGDEGVTVVLDDGEELVVDGTPVRGRHTFGGIPERGGTEAAWGDTVIEVAERGGRYVIRPRDPRHPLRTGFTGTPAYAPDPRWVVTGTYTAFAEPRPTTVGAVVEGLQHVYDAPGTIRFGIDGLTPDLTAFTGGTPGSLLVLFSDATSGVTTYGAGRALHVDAPAPDGTVVLDFNRATNLPCAYTDFATCPLPPAGNRLAVAVEAGERIPHERRRTAR
ncbi:DUF1684 domain-containing protein [Streptomyces sp. NPDC057837]|uniref:DUF1684 domain-containing protein n=1 Tax=Streptomyces sp. NPDC057837 TaxID=3346260 RepID=UPI0036A2065A